MRFKGARVSLPEIARALDVDAVVEGTVMRSGDRVRITAQVIQARPERDLWAECYERPLGDVVSLQGEVTREIAQAIRVTLSSQEQRGLGRAPAVEPDAYEAFLEGRYYWNKRTEVSTKKAIDYFQRAIARDPRYALAYTGLADSQISLSLTEALQEVVPPKDAFPDATAAVTRALAIDDTLAEAHASLAHIKFQYERDWAGAEQEFIRAIELNPNYANAHHWYALSLLWLGRPDDTLREIERAHALDPLSLVIDANMGLILAHAHQDDRGIAQCRKALDLDPTFAFAHHRLGQIYVLRGMYAQAIPELEQAIALSGQSPRAIAELGLAYALSGNRRAALTQLEALQWQSTQRYVSPFNMAVIDAALDDKTQTFTCLQRAYEERSPSLSTLLMNPAFARIRTDHRFIALVRGIGLRS